MAQRFALALRFSRRMDSALAKGGVNACMMMSWILHRF
jgi:hypothetical protein